LKKKIKIETENFYGKKKVQSIASKALTTYGLISETPTFLKYTLKLIRSLQHKTGE